MFGNFLSSAIRVVTLPIDASSAVADLATGGDGSKRSRTTDNCSPFSLAEELRDKVAAAAKEIDE